MASETQGRPASEKKLEQYGVWVKVKPQEVPESAAPQESMLLSDLDASTPAQSRAFSPATSTLTAEEEKLLDELGSELEPRDAATAPGEEPILAETELTEEELPELDDEPLTLGRRGSRATESRSGIRRPVPAAEQSEIEVTLSEDAGKEEHFDDLAALETELASVGASARGAPASSAPSARTLSRIEDELRSIRADLTQLRTELSGLRGKAGAEPVAARTHAESTGGFFDEDEDETIALTGDELDNILNTAEVTEESAEAAGEAPAEELSPLGIEAGPKDDILGYDTPDVSSAARAPSAEEIELAEEVQAEDETLVLSEEALLPGEDEGSAELEELPSELVLDDLGVEKDAESPKPEEALEEIPELEGTSTGQGSQDNGSDETIDLETLDIGEEPKIIDAVPEQVDDLEAVVDAEPVLDEEPTAAAAASSADDVLSDDVDLEALAAEAAELEDEAPLGPPRAAKTREAPVQDVEPAAAVEEIEIPFEAEHTRPSPDVDAELEQILDTEEVVGQPASMNEESAENVEEAEEAEEAEAAEEPPHAAPAAKGSSASGPAAGGAIPDTLKDEIRTVLKYMDHLLEALPDDKIQEFASSDYFVMYKKLFEDLGLGE